MSTANDSLLEHVAELHSRQAGDRVQRSDEDSVKLVKGVIVVVGIIVVFGLLTMARGGKPPAAPTISHSAPDGSMAHVMAQKLVKAQLKAPSTAKFPSAEYTATDLGGGRWRVSSYVDAQNGFGAMLRSQWTVEMEATGETWKLVKCSID